MKNGLKISVLFSMLVLGACGKVGNLEPRAGSNPIPAAYGKAKPATADELVTANAQGRPGRSVELLKRSQRREDDPFDLPPGKEPVAELNTDLKTMDQTPTPSPKNQ